MRHQMVMSLGQLIESSSKVVSLHGEHNYGKESIFKKEFGQIFYSDKVVYYNEDYKMLEIRVIMGTRTESGYSGYHAVRMAFADVEGTVYRSEAALLKALGKDSSNTEEKEVKKRGRKKKIEDISVEQATANDVERKKEFKGIIIPCTGRNSKESNNFFSNGKFFYSKKGISLANKCVVSCTCSSYKFTFAEANWNNYAHLGVKPARYFKRAKMNVSTGFKVTKKGKIKRSGSMDIINPNFNKSVLNVNNTPGLCKHLMLLATLLVEGSILSSERKDNGHYEFASLHKDIRQLMKDNQKRSAESSKEIKTSIIKDRARMWMDMERAIGSKQDPGYHEQRDRDIRQNYAKETLTEARDDLKESRANINSNKPVEQHNLRKDTVLPAERSLTSKDAAKGLYDDLTSAMLSNAKNPMDAGALRAALEDLNHSDRNSFRNYIHKFMGTKGLERYNKIIQSGGFDE